MLDHLGSSLSFPTKESACARASTLPHRAHLRAVFGPAARKGGRPSARMPPPCIPDRVVFENCGVRLVQVLVFGCAYERIADRMCSATTLRDRRDEWIELGVMDALRESALEAYDRFVGLEVADVAVDCCITKAPCGGEKAGRSPVDRGKQGTKRSTAVDARGIPLGTITAPANQHDSPLLVVTLERAGASVGGLPEGTSVHLDRGYDSELTRERLESGVDCSQRSLERESLLHFRQRSAGSWRGRAPGITPTKSWCGARRSRQGWWTSGWLSQR